MNPSEPPRSSPPPPAVELAMLNHELAQLDARRSQLLVRRAWLLSAMQHPVAPRAHAVTAPRAAAVAPETSRHGAQNALLVLGGVLLAIAAIAFTLVSWGSMGIGGRGAVLATITAAALLAPVALLRRGLASTAESVASLALVLTVLDAYALRQVALSDASGTGYAAGAAAVLAALWAGYGRWLTALRLPLPLAVACAQLPLGLWAVTVSPGVLQLGWALVATAAFDVAVAVAVARRAVRVSATVGAVVAGGWAGAIGVLESAAAGSATGALLSGVLLAAVAAVALGWAWRTSEGALSMATAAGFALTAAAGGLLRQVFPAGWAVPAYLLAAIAVLAVLAALAATGSGLPRPMARGLALASAAVHTGAVLVTLPLLAIVLGGPAETVADGIWQGEPFDVHSAIGSVLLPVDFAPAPVVLLLAATAPLAWLARLRTAPRPTAADARPADLARGLSVALVWAALLTVPVALTWAYPVAVAYGLALTLAVLALSTRRSAALAPVALGCALVGAGSLGALALATRPATFTVLGVLVAALAGAAVVTRAGDAVRAAQAVAATFFGCWLVLALARAAELSWHGAGLALLVVPAVACLIAARAAGRPASGASSPADGSSAAVRPLSHPLTLALEVAAAVAAAGAVLLTAGRLPMLSLALALTGVIAAGTAIRPQRRATAGTLAVVLFVGASWARLAASEVTLPEAYTLPVTVPALVVGALRRRRDPQAPSWTAYGPGLAVTLLPSLSAAWGDAHWVRPLLLGLAALVVTLVGARLRLQAPLVLGGAVLALVALHELAPYVAQVVGALPRWLPPAAAGLLLLTVGATYEQRLRDARRLRESLGRLG
ncbi:SCO7613 C-terminal domain-containing membrane protein [Streptomyces sp. NPDC003860]